MSPDAAEVILHEFGHAIQDAIIPGSGQSHAGGAMGEGFGDYLAASFSSPVKSTKREPRFAEWDVKAVKVSMEDCIRSGKVLYTPRMSWRGPGRSFLC